MTTTTAAPVNRSWAQRVQGDTKNAAENNQKSIKPSRRGSLLRFCRGEVLSMLSHYGWLMVYGNVDDPSTEKHGGDVYIHKDDIVDGESLCPGDVVSFYLYADEQGLGAEMCSVEEKASNAKPAAQQEGFSMNACAKEFVPASCWSMLAQKEPVVVDNVADVFLRLSQVFSSDDEDSDADDDSDEECQLARPWIFKRAQSSDGSTCGGATSDSEEELSAAEASDTESETEVAPTCKWRPPPGLSLPEVGLTAPPGLLPPGLEASRVDAHGRMSMEELRGIKSCR